VYILSAVTPETTGTAEAGSSFTESPLFPFVMVIGGILVAWIALNYLWNNKYRPKRVKAGAAVASFNNILGRFLRFLFKEDKVQSAKIKIPFLKKLLVWRNFYFACIAAIIVMPLIKMDALPIAIAFFVVAMTRTQKVFRDRHRILMRMFDVASVGLGYPRESTANPWTWVNIKKWQDMTTPGDTVVRFPAKFKSGEQKNREAFENHFSSTVTDGNSWIFTWKHADSAVTLTPVTHIPERAEYKGSAHAKWDEIPLGIGTNGEVVWEISKAPHALVTGSTGAGKSVLQRNLIFHCIQHPDKWRFLGIDVKMVELTPYLKYEPVVMGVATNVEDGVEIIRYANEEMQNRYKMMTEKGVNNFRDLSDPPHALMVMIDESYAFLAVTGNKTDDGKAKDALKGEASAAIGDIARLGRAAGVHLVMATQRPDATVIYGELKQNLSARIAAGRADTIASQMTLDNDQATRLPPTKGRGYFQQHGAGEQFQGYFAEQSWIDNWLTAKENGTDIVEEAPQEAIEAPKKKLGKLFGKKNKEESVVVPEAEDEFVDLLEDGLEDAFDDIPEPDNTNKDLASLVNDFQNVDDNEYDDPFDNGEPSMFDEVEMETPQKKENPVMPAKVSPLPAVALPEDKPDLDSLFGDLDDDYDSMFTPVTNAPVKEVAKEAESPFGGNFIPESDDDLFFDGLDSTPPPAAPVKTPVKQTAPPVKTAPKAPVTAIAKAPVRPAMPSRPSAPKRPGS
jgi:hypothetical protein